MKYNFPLLISMILLTILFAFPLMMDTLQPEINAIFVIATLLIGSIPSTIALIKGKSTQTVRKLEFYSLLPAIWIVIGYVVYCYLT
jgi:hypothetical protein